MAISPSRPTLYRSARRFVILIALLALPAPAQTQRNAKPYKGPRAIGLVELTPDGKPHFIPIAILINGEFYDASAYKADPVPMALWSETVYEGVRTGVSQGLFTVTGAQENQKTNEWVAEGSWLPAGSIPAKSAKKHESSVPRGIDEDTGPPVLRHSGANKPAPPPATAPQTPPAADNTKPASTTPATSSEGTAAQTQQASSAPPAAQTTPTDSSAPPAEQDPNAPVLKRGRPAPKPPEILTPPPPLAKTTTKAPAAAVVPKQPTMQVFPAISDVDGPEPRPYGYNMNSGEEEEFRKKMLALAADEVTARAKMLASELGSSQSAQSSSRRQAARKPQPLQPDFQNVELRAFDLSASNEPTLVLYATARMPKTAGGAQGPFADLLYAITLVAREDINGDFHKAFSQVTDVDHLDVLPRYELIDAVDADGDGRGELLFRLISDTGTAFSIYRVIGDQLYPLFQGTL
jgi:hypothetical protein